MRLVIGARAGRSAVGRQRVESLERGEQRGGPGPVVLEMQRGAPGVARQARGDVQDAVAQPLGLSDRVLTLQAGVLGPDGQVVCDQRDLKPRGVGLPVAEGQVGEAHRFEAADAVLDDGVLAMTSLQTREAVMKH